MNLDEWLAASPKNIPIKDQINRHRRVLLVHSIIYYVYDDNIFSDYEYDAWGKRLIELQRRYPEESESVSYYLDVFRNFTGTSSGYDLPLKDPAANRIARSLLEQRDIRRK